MKKKLDMMIVHALGTSSSIWSSKRPTSRTAIEFTSRQTKRTTHAFDVSVPEMIYINYVYLIMPRFETFDLRLTSWHSISGATAADSWMYHSCTQKFKEDVHCKTGM